MHKFLDLQNINLYSIVRDVLNRIWIVLIVGCLGIMVSFIFLKKEYVPTYTSSAIYVINPSQSTGFVMGNKVVADSVVEAFNSLLDSDVMLGRINRDLKRTDSSESKKEATLIEQTNLMKFTVTSNDPIVSYQTISAAMNSYYELSDYLNADAVFDVIREPTIAQNPNNAFTPRIRSLEVGGVCALLMLLIIILISIFRKTIKTENAVKESLGVNLLGVINHENKNKTIKAKVVQSVKSLLITSPIISNAFIEDINNIRTKIEYEKENDSSKNTFMITSVCENEGKSTVAMNVALSLAKEGKKVILIDADMRKPAAYKMLDIPKRKITDMSKLLLGKIGLDEAMYKGKNIPIDIIMSNKSHSRTNEYMKSAAMFDLIEKCKLLADFVIIDTPPMALVSDAEALLDRVDYAILVTRQDFSYTNDVMNCIELIEESNAKFTGCILNDYKTLKFRPKRNAHRYDYNSVNGEKVVEIYEK